MKEERIRGMRGEGRMPRSSGGIQVTRAGMRNGQGRRERKDEQQQRSNTMMRVGVTQDTKLTVSLRRLGSFCVIHGPEA